MRLKREVKGLIPEGFLCQSTNIRIFFFLKATGVTEELGMSGLCSAKKHPSCIEGKCVEAEIVEAMG